MHNYSTCNFIMSSEFDVEQALQYIKDVKLAPISKEQSRTLAAARTVTSGDAYVNRGSIQYVGGLPEQSKVRRASASNIFVLKILCRPMLCIGPFSVNWLLMPKSIARQTRPPGKFVFHGNVGALNTSP